MKKFTIPLLTLALLIITGNVLVHAQRVTVTIAGNGTPGFTGDGGWGKTAQISAPYDVCHDAANNVYFTDMANGRVRKISVQNGKITTIAGGGTSTADGIPAVNALISPKNMCIDAAGNIYIVSNSTNQIKRIDAATNIITTVAGTGTAGYSGDGGSALSAQFNGMLGICISPAGNIYVSDSGNNCIRKIAAGTGIVTTIAGTGTPGYTGDGGAAVAATLHSPTAINVTAAEDVYVMDQSGWTVFNAHLRKITAATGLISTVAGAPSGGSIFGTSLLTTFLADVTGLCMDDSGNFFCNEVSCSCRELDMSMDMTYAVAGNFGIESYAENVNSNLAYMNTPYGLSMDAARNLYAADNFNNRIRKIIQLTHTPTFSYGRGAYLYVCPGSTVSFDSMLTVTDIDAGQTETYTVISAPAHGTITGFPATVTSVGDAGISRPSTGASYTSSATYSGSDEFKVQVSDGALMDTFTIYVDNGVASIAGANTVCAEAGITLTNEFAGGAWTLSNANASVSGTGVVTGNIAGTDVLYYTVVTACGEQTTQTTITINPVAVAGAISGVASICSGATTVFTNPTAVGTGSWSVSNSHSSITTAGVLTGLSVGVDSVLFTATNSCGSAAASKLINVTHCSNAGVASVSFPTPEMYPNPASAELNVQWDELYNGNATVSIADVTGRVVLTAALNNSNSGAATVNVASLKDGVYLVTFSNATTHFTDKMVISK